MLVGDECSPMEITRLRRMAGREEELEKLLGLAQRQVADKEVRILAHLPSFNLCGLQRGIATGPNWEAKLTAVIALRPRS